MSHFAILAVRKAGNPISYEEAMERYNECAEVEPYIYKTYEEAAEAGGAGRREERNGNEPALRQTA